MMDEQGTKAYPIDELVLLGRRNSDLETGLRCNLSGTLRVHFEYTADEPMAAVGMAQALVEVGRGWRVRVLRTNRCRALEKVMVRREGRDGESCARILIVDDHPLVRLGLRQLISDEANLEVCGEAEGASQALELMARLKPDVAVIDISLKEGNGVELLKKAKSRFKSVKLLVYSMHDEVLFAERTLRAGAMGYVNKQTANESIVAAIEQVLEGKIVVSDRVTERMLARMASSDERGAMEPVASLSNRELEVFELIGRGLTMREIADRLNRSIKTIETHRERLKRKLSLDGPNELLRRAMQWVVDGD